MDKKCNLKDHWSVVYLSFKETNSCHRCHHHSYDFDFHNTEEKQNDRKLMSDNVWPETGCQYCKNIEDAGGVSDRIQAQTHDIFKTTKENNLLVLEAYFSNKCNMACVYCTEYYSSLWEKENERFGRINGNAKRKVENYEEVKNDFWRWMKDNSDDLRVFKWLGGEPLYQEEFYEVVEFFENNPRPDLEIQMFTNLKSNKKNLESKLKTLTNLLKSKKVKSVVLQLSIECWGKEQEYVRYGLYLSEWEDNFRMLMEDFRELEVKINGVLTTLTIKTAPELKRKVNEICRESIREEIDIVWSLVSPHDTFFNPKYFHSGFFDKELDELGLNRYKTLFNSTDYDESKMKELRNFLHSIDLRRNLNYEEIFPWLKQN